VQALGRLPNRHVRVGVRPVDIAIVPSVGGATLSAEVLVVEPSERTLVATLRGGGTDFRLKTQAGAAIRPGDQVQVRLDPARLYHFDPDSGLALAGRPAAPDASR
jgi:ABC-type sugar transport system ATPase subunit